MRVVVAEDSPAIRSRLRSLLCAIDGVEIVGCAADGAEALDLVERHRPEALILDLGLPRLGGIEVLRCLGGRKPELVIVLTDDAEPPFRQACLGLGADYFLDKALEFDRALRIIDERVARKAEPH